MENEMPSSTKSFENRHATNVDNHENIFNFFSFFLSWKHFFSSTTKVPTFVFFLVFGIFLDTVFFGTSATKEGVTGPLASDTAVLGNKPNTKSRFWSKKKLKRKCRFRGFRRRWFQIFRSRNKIRKELEKTILDFRKFIFE